MVKIIGRFYFKQTSNGNLVGEFSNNHSHDKITTESADLISGSGKNFIGTYNATWQEAGTAFFATLVISPKNGSAKLFILDWKASKCGFAGEGMLCDDILIGDYHEV